MVENNFNPGSVHSTALGQYAMLDRTEDFLIGLVKTEVGFFTSRAGWVLSKIPPARITGTYLLADGTSTMLGGVEMMSEGIYGREFDYNLDFMEAAYRNAGEFYVGDPNYGSAARAVVSLGGIWRANTVPVNTLVNYNPSWGTSEFTYSDILPAYYSATRGVLAMDVVGAADAINTISKNSGDD